MKYDPETTTVEFTVRVPVDWIPAIAESHGTSEAPESWVPLGALMHLLDTHKAELPVHRILMAIMDHEDFDDSVASVGLLQRYEAAPRLELVPLEPRPA